MKLFLIIGVVCLSVGFVEAKEFFPPTCKVDVELQCKGVRPGKNRIKKCLKKNSEHIDPVCKEDLMVKAKK